MISMTSVEAQSRFGELVDRSQREPIAVTRRGRTVAYVVSGHDMQALADVTQRRQKAARWYAQYRAEVLPAAMAQAAAVLTDEDVADMVKALR
jgi:antitoxin Phd